MLADHVSDFFLETGAAAVLGLLGFAVYLFLRRRWRDRATQTSLPAGTAEMLGAVLAGLATIFSFGQFVDAENVAHGIGAGEPLSLAIAATGAALVFAFALRRVLRTRTG